MFSIFAYPDFSELPIGLCSFLQIIFVFNFLISIFIQLSHVPWFYFVVWTYLIYSFIFTIFLRKTSSVTSIAIASKIM